MLDFLHVEDAAAAFVALLDSDVCGPVNIGSGTPLLVRDVLQEIGAQLGRPELIHFGARANTSSDQRIWANVARLLNEVGFTPRYDLQTGIEQTIKWWRTRPGNRQRDSAPAVSAPTTSS